MKNKSAALQILATIFLATSVCSAATIQGIVRGSDGVPIPLAFVQARNSRTKITTMALSDDKGQYEIVSLRAGEYEMRVKAIGFENAGATSISISAAALKSRNFILRKAGVPWNELSIYQADKLWPTSKSKDKLFADCFVCHGFQTRMASVRRDQDDWKDRVHYMREAMRFSLQNRLSDTDAADIASYLTNLFGPTSQLPKSADQMPGYAGTVRHFAPEASRIAYVEYELPRPSQFPFSAAPDKAGKIWIPNFGVANAISRLDPATGTFEIFPVPNVGTAAVHSALAAKDGSVWLTEQGSDKLGRWDPSTQKIAEYQSPHVPSDPGFPPGSRHTLRFDGSGNVWSGSYPMTRFDPETEKFTVIKGVPITYSLIFDKQGNPWFTAPFASQIGKVDAQTLKVTLWNVPTAKSYPRRLDIDSHGAVWFGEFTAGKIGRFDPQTQTFKEYPLPGPEATPYAVIVGSDNNVWYSSYNLDVIGRLDPTTGNVTEYPFPHSENTIREFFRDGQGHIWYGSPSNNRVGYFYLQN